MSHQKALGTAIKGNIAILGTRGIPAMYGGFETFAENLAVGLVNEGWNVSVYCETSSPQLERQFFGVRLKYVSAPRLGPVSTLYFDIKCLWQARKRCDVIYMLGYGAAVAFPISRLNGAKLWVNMDGLEWRRSKWNGLARFWLRTMEFFAVKFANMLIADAVGIKNYLSEKYDGMAPCVVVPYGAEIVKDATEQAIRDYGLLPHQYFLVVARLEPENHVIEIIEGYLASKTSYPLVIVGGHTDNTRYQEALLHLSCPQVIFLGGVYEPRRLQSLRFFCTAYLHGHSVGGTNPSLLEAMACGNSIFAHDNSFNREVTDGKAYFFHDPSSLTDIFNSFDPEDSDVADWKQQCVDRVKEKYNWNIIVRRYSDLLTEAIEINK